MPYNYVAAADSAPFSEAPAAVMECLSRLIWAGTTVTNGSPRPLFNELLAVGYFETMKMDVSVLPCGPEHLLVWAPAKSLQYHDDGEKTLGDLVATWSLGAPGDMFFRIKKAYAHPVLNEASYDPTEEVVKGSDYWQERAALNNVDAHPHRPQSKTKQALPRQKFLPALIYQGYKREIDCQELGEESLRSRAVPHSHVNRFGNTLLDDGFSLWSNNHGFAGPSTSAFAGFSSNA